MTAINRCGGPRQEAATKTLAPVATITPGSELHAILVLTPKSRYGKRLFLSLDHAERAVQRARYEGKPAWMILVKVTPVIEEAGPDDD